MIEIFPLGAESDGQVNIVLDQRFGVIADSDEARKWIPLIAHALAIGGGYTSHGKNSRRANPHKVQIFEVQGE